MSVRLAIAETTHAFDAPEGDDLLEIIQRSGHPISTSCGGLASCGHCRLHVIEGQDLLSPITPEEITHLGNVAKVIGARLACQARVCALDGTLVVRVPEVTDIEGRNRRKVERMQLDRRARAGSPTPAAGPPRQIIEWRPGRMATPKT